MLSEYMNNSDRIVLEDKRDLTDEKEIEER